MAHMGTGTFTPPECVFMTIIFLIIIFGYASLSFFMMIWNLF